MVKPMRREEEEEEEEGNSIYDNEMVKSLNNLLELHVFTCRYVRFG